MDRTTGKVEVTAHNHGFAVDAPLDRSTPTPYGSATVSHVCLNDDVVEGLELVDAEGRLRAFSVQYHPEAAAGPHDAGYLFDRFVDLMQPPTGSPAEEPTAAPPAEEPTTARHAAQPRRFLAPRRASAEEPGLGQDTPGLGTSVAPRRASTEGGEG
jgi:hypothetical protein